MKHFICKRDRLLITQKRLNYVTRGAKRTQQHKSLRLTEKQYERGITKGGDELGHSHVADANKQLSVIWRRVSHCFRRCEDDRDDSGSSCSNNSSCSSICRLGNRGNHPASSTLITDAGTGLVIYPNSIEQKLMRSLNPLLNVQSNLEENDEEQKQPMDGRQRQLAG